MSRKRTKAFGYFPAFFVYSPILFCHKAVDRKNILCYANTTTNIAMIIVATIDVSMTVVALSVGDETEST